MGNYTSFGSKTYDFYNTGYKIHLPVLPDSSDSLTRRIADFLDKKFGLKSCYEHQYESEGNFYKIGCGGELEDGKGITIYGKNGSRQEMKELAEEIEKKFGKELTDNITKYNIKPTNPLQLTDSITGRFAAYGHTFGDDTKIFDRNYSFKQNKSGALPLKEFTTILGEKKNCPVSLKTLKSWADIDQKFFHGESTIYAIDTFGEFFTGKLEGGKIPQHILDGLPEEYRAIHNLTDKNIIARINKGTTNIVAAMLKDVAVNPKSKILSEPWLAKLNTEVIDEAIQYLAKCEPDSFQILEQKMPELVKKCPSLSVLEKTPTLSKVRKVGDFSDKIAKMFNSKTKLSNFGKVGLCITGVAMLSAGAVSIFNQDKKEVLLAKNNELSQKTSICTKPSLTNSSCLTI